MELLLRCRKFSIVRRPVTSPDGRERPHEYVVHPGAVVVLPLLDEAHCLMIRQYRTTVEQELWELPAGTLDKPGEPPESAALRELEEETGYRAGQLRYLCGFYTSPGILNEFIRAYIATDLTKAQQNLDPGERIEVEEMDLARTLDMIREGSIIDAKTIVTLLRWDLERRGHP